MRDGTQVECIICFEPLCESPVAVFRKSAKRACRHFFHRHCADACPVARGCPLCRADYSEVYTVPSWTYHEAWFEIMDISSSGCLTLQELCEAVVATVPVSSCALEAMLPTLWTARGKRLQEPMNFQDLFGHGGLLLDLQDSVRLMPAGLVSQRLDACPDFGSDKRAWFEYWDTDKSGVLEREEVVRGLVKSFKSDVPHRLCKKRLRMRYLVEEMWPLVDFDGNGRISVEEFCRKGGLADLILQNFTAKSSPRSSPQATTVRRSGVEKNALLSRKTWPESLLDIDDVPEDKPSLVQRASLGFNPRTLEEPDAGDGTPTSSSGLPASWSVLGRRKSTGSVEERVSPTTIGGLKNRKSLPAELPSACSTPTSEASLRRSSNARIFDDLLERPRSPQGVRSPRSDRRRSKSKEPTGRVHGMPSSDSASSPSKSKEPVANSDFFFNTAPT